MLDDLRTASTVLHTALEGYISACSALCNDRSDETSVSSARKFLDSVLDELDLIKYYKEKLVQAEVAVKRKKNNLVDVPINGLPPEVLTYIFHLVLAQQPCPLRVDRYWDPNNPARLPMYPDTFSHVCSYWRRIALASPLLWSHIDIALSCPLSTAFHRRAQAYLSRARQIPLDIHLIDPGCYGPKRPRVCECGEAHECAEDDDDRDCYDWEEWINDKNPQEFTFLSSSVAPIIKSVGLKTHKDHHVVYNRALSYCLANCLPGDLVELVILLHDQSIGILNPRPDSQLPTEELAYYQLSLNEQELERVCRSVSTLQVNSGYLGWNSTLYHGLTEFRLFGVTTIKDRDFIRILQSSPKLRVLQCAFNSMPSDRSNALPVPVILEDLEILDLSMTWDTCVESCLRYINPGSKPLRLLVNGSPTSAIFEDFFARSNVHEFHVTPGYNYRRRSPALPDAFSLPSQLRALVMTRWDWSQDRQSSRWGETSFEAMKTPCPVQLEALSMIDCCYKNFDQFEQIVRYFSPQQLVVQDCVTFISGKKRNIDPHIGARFGGNISQICPSTQYLMSEDIYNLKDWESE
ncbi:unnamed protein product [Rhizoctonia solani]|uniref:F-box domain-containing protein n=1 Tax=Rhizoctonia solani TaxID=456999 RepID=A0A8H3GTS3_9AGAM|nr:unnamed protein product [Rhizoctonia solani]